MSSGETNLQALLSSLQPALDEREFVFATLPKDEIANALYSGAICVFQENEGFTVIADTDVAKQLSIPIHDVFKMITMHVHSSLYAVGLTAALSKALADVNISANVVAAYYHDHIFVPADDAGKALDALWTLSKKGQ